MKPNVVASRASSHIEASTQAVGPHAMQRSCHNERIVKREQNRPIDDDFSFTAVSSYYLSWQRQIRAEQKLIAGTKTGRSCAMRHVRGGNTGQKEINANRLRKGHILAISHNLSLAGHDEPA
jgi:hypothetical protein